MDYIGPKGNRGSYFLSKNQPDFKFCKKMKENFVPVLTYSLYSGREMRSRK